MPDLGAFANQFDGGASFEQKFNDIFYKHGHRHSRAHSGSWLYVHLPVSVQGQEPTPRLFRDGPLSIFLINIWPNIGEARRKASAKIRNLDARRRTCATEGLPWRTAGRLRGSEL